MVRRPFNTSHASWVAFLASAALCLLGRCVVRECLRARVYLFKTIAVANPPPPTALPLAVQLFKTSESMLRFALPVAPCRLKHRGGLRLGGLRGLRRVRLWVYEVLAACR